MFADVLLCERRHLLCGPWISDWGSRSSFVRTSLSRKEESAKKRAQISRLRNINELIKPVIAIARQSSLDACKLL